MEKSIIITAARPWTLARAKNFKFSGYRTHIITGRNELTSEAVEEINPKYIFFPHWSWYIPEEIYNNYECIIFHPGDVPLGRGGTPIQNQIAQGRSETMLSAIRAAKDIDAGEIYLKQKLSLLGGGEEIMIRMQNTVFDEMIPYILKHDITPTPQKGDVTTFKRRTPKMSKLSPDMTIEQIFDMIRMLDIEGYPNAYLEFGDYSLSFTRASLRTDGIEATVKISEKNADTDMKGIKSK